MITPGGGGSSGPPAFAFGTAAARPAAAASNANTGYFATDTGEVTFSDGTTWHVIQQTSAASFTVASNGGKLQVWGGNSSDLIVYSATGNAFQITDPVTSSVVGNGGNGLLTGGVDVNTAGHGLKVAEGANAKQGTAVLVAGAVTVANTSVTATSRILLTSQVDGGAPGWLRVSARVAGTSFTITSSSATDTSTVAYEIFEVG